VSEILQRQADGGRDEKASNTYIFARVILRCPSLYHRRVRTALSLTLVIIVILEMFIGTDKGLASHLQCHMTYQIPQMYATIVITGLIGYE